MKEKGTVLVIDDDRDFYLLVYRYLYNEGYQVLVSSSGKEALEVLSKKKINLILLDLNFPGDKGEDILQIILKNKKHPKVIILSSNNDIEKAVKLIKMGAEDYIVKPILKETFIEKITSILEK